MSVGKENFEARIYGDGLRRVMECLPSDDALTMDEIKARTGIPKKTLTTVLPALFELGYIENKWIDGTRHYLKLTPRSRQEWYTIDEAARYLRVSKRTIYQLIEHGVLVHYRVAGGVRKRFKHDDLEQVMKTEDRGSLHEMNAAADPVLAELWGNSRDAEYDNI